MQGEGVRYQAKSFGQLQKCEVANQTWKQFSDFHTGQFEEHKDHNALTMWKLYMQKQQIVTDKHRTQSSKHRKCLSCCVHLSVHVETFSDLFAGRIYQLQEHKLLGMAVTFQDSQKCY